MESNENYRANRYEPLRWFVEQIFPQFEVDWIAIEPGLTVNTLDRGEYLSRRFFVSGHRSP